MAYKINGETLPLGRSFTLGNIMYPANWLQKSTETERTAVGITWEDDPVRADDRYYWDGDINNPKMLDDRLEVDENGQPLYEQVWDATANNGEGAMVPKQPLVQVKTHGLKSTMTAQVKHTAGTLLVNTDWYVIRATERHVPIPANVTTKRTAIVAESTRLEIAIKACTTVEELITVMNSQDWGE